MTVAPPPPIPLSSSSPPSTQLEKLLQRLSRQFSSHRSGGATATTAATTTRTRPPDAAAAALGRELARHVVATSSSSSTSSHDEAVTWRAFVRAANNGMPPSVPHAFFVAVAERMKGDGGGGAPTTGADKNHPPAASFDWVSRWILQTEEAILGGGTAAAAGGGGGAGGGAPSSSATNIGLRHLLDAAIRAYAFWVVAQQIDLILMGGNDDDDDVDDGPMSSSSMSYRSYKSNDRNQQQQEQRIQQSVLDVYRRLQLHSSRRYLLKAVLDTAVGGMEEQFQESKEQVPPKCLGLTIPILLSPFLVVAILTKRKPAGAASSSGGDDKSAALSLFFRSIWSAWTSPMKTTEQDCFYLLEWMTDGLLIHLNASTSADTVSGTTIGSYYDVLPAALGLAESWVVELCFLVQALYNTPQRKDQKRDASEHPDPLDGWLRIILYDVLPRISGVCCYADQTPLIQGIMDVASLATPRFGLDGPMALRLAVTALMTANPNDRVNVLELLRHPSLRPVSRAALSLCQSVASISMQDEDCRETAVKLYDKLQLCEKDLSYVYNFSLCAPARTTNLMHVADQLEGSDDMDEGSTLIDRVASSRRFENTDLSAAQQIASLLFGIFLLDSDDEEGREDRGIPFLSDLLTHAPHLSISLMPVVMDRINRASKIIDGPQLMRYLNFLCTGLARDPHCAQEIWFLIGGKMMHADVPLPVRVAVIRLFPKLCDTNKRLYRRIIDSLESSVTNRQPEIRLAVAATLSELAQNDLIRDVSDVIGWIQGLLTEEREKPLHSLLVHYALMSLHYLVVAGELDFDVVIKVLSKRLCSVADFGAISELPTVVQDALVLLLGDGECDGDSSSENDEDEGDDGRQHSSSEVSPQVSSAVRTLVRLGTLLVGQDSELDVNQAKVLENIFISLSTYSSQALGLSEEGIEAVVSGMEGEDDPQGYLSDASARYVGLRDLAIAGMGRTSLETYNLTQDDPCVQLTRKLLEFEELTLGAAFWKKHSGSGRRQTKGSPTSKVGLAADSQPSLQMLPEYSEIQSLASLRASAASAVSLLLASDGSQLSTIRDNGDAALEITDPLFLVFALQAYLHASLCVVSNTPREEVKSILAEIRSWNEVFVSPDTMYLALASISIYIPTDLQEDSSSSSSLVEDIFNIVTEAFKSSRFEREVIGKICIGLVAVSSLRSASMDKAMEVVTTLEQSVRAYGGQQCFGAYYGLAIVCQALQNLIDSDILLPVVDDAKMAVFRICGFLLEELLSCYEERGEIFASLIDCLKSGDATSNLVGSLSDLDVSSISLLMTKQVNARYLFISCAICLPGLSKLNAPLHLATLRMLEAFEWGGGKGIVLPPMLRACWKANLFEAEELNQIYSSFAATFNERMDSEDAGIDSEGLDDIFYALNGTSAKPATHLIRRTLVGNKDLFDDDEGMVLSLIAMIVSVVKIPCLGASYFALQPELRSDVNTNELESIVGIIREAVMSPGDSKFAGMGMILLGFLSSMRIARRLDADVAAQSKTTATSPAKENKELDFDKLSSPHPGTVLAGILQTIEQHADPVAKRNEIPLVRALSSLECLSLPDQCAKSFIEPLMHHNKGAIALGSVSLLCSQVRGRRRVSFSGSDFVVSALSLSKLDNRQWNELASAGECIKIFVQHIPEMMKKIPPESATQVLETLWSNVRSMVQRFPEITLAFLASTKAVLGSSVLSSTTVEATRQVLSRVSKDLPQYPLSTLLMKTNSSTSIFDEFVCCLQEMPHEAIDEDDYVNVIPSLDRFEAEVVKLLSLASLVDSEYFHTPQKRTAELSRVASWISKKLQSVQHEVESELYALRQVIVSFAIAATKESTSVKKDRLSTLLDALLLSRKVTSRIALDWLAVVMAYWCERDGSDVEITLGFLCVQAPEIPRSSTAADLDTWCQILVADLPHNLAVYSYREKISGTVSNQLHRLLVHWSEEDADGDILECIRKTIFSCQSTNEDVFTSLASWTLSSRQLNPAFSTTLESGVADLDIRVE